MPRPDKVDAVAEIKGYFEDSNGAVLTEYRGLSVAQISELRRSLAGNAKFRIAKNTLTKIAAREAGLAPEVQDLLQGPSAIAFVDGDVVEAAKGLNDFAKAHPSLVIKGGVIDGNPMTPEQITKIASLESREVLLAKLAGAMKASMGNAAAVFNALPVKTAQLAEALRAKREEAGGESAQPPDEG